MGIKKTKNNFRVEVTPRGPGDFGICYISGQSRTEGEWKSLCDDIAQQIRRHVNEVGSVAVLFDTEKTCEHCGWKWTEGDDSPHNGGCCGKDCEVFEALQPAEAPNA